MQIFYSYCSSLVWILAKSLAKPTTSKQLLLCGQFVPFSFSLIWLLFHYLSLSLARVEYLSAWLSLALALPALPALSCVLCFRFCTPLFSLVCSVAFWHRILSLSLPQSLLRPLRPRSALTSTIVPFDFECIQGRLQLCRASNNIDKGTISDCRIGVWPVYLLCRW